MNLIVALIMKEILPDKFRNFIIGFNKQMRGQIEYSGCR